MLVVAFPPFLFLSLLTWIVLLLIYNAFYLLALFSISWPKNMFDFTKLACAVVNLWLFTERSYGSHLFKKKRWFIARAWPYWSSSKLIESQVDYKVYYCLSFWDSAEFGVSQHFRIGCLCQLDTSFLFHEILFISGSVSMMLTLNFVIKMSRYMCMCSSKGFLRSKLP